MPADFSDSIKQGFRIVNRNWQLVLARVAASFINWLTMFIVVGIPLFIAVMVVGVELATSSAQAFISGLKDAFENGYIGIVLMILASVLLYFVIVSLVWIYVMSGCMGVIAVSVEKNAGKIFAGRLFFSSAKTHLRRLTGFYALLGLFALALSILAGVAVGGAVYLSDILKQSSTFFGVLFWIALYVFITVFVIASVLGGLSVGAFGAAVAVFEKKDAWDALKRSLSFLRDDPGALLKFSLLFLLYTVVTFIIFALLSPFFLVGVFFAFPYMVVTYTAEYYLGLCLTASVFSYYFKKTGAGISQEIAGTEAQQAGRQAEGWPQEQPQTPLSNLQ